MGYYSDVVIAVAFADELTAQRVFAVYSLLPDVVEHKVAVQWKLHRLPDAVIWVTRQDDVKWYPQFGDVQAVEALARLAQEAEVPFAWRFLRVGEDVDDVEDNGMANDDTVSAELDQLLSDSMGVARTIYADFGKGE